MDWVAVCVGFLVRGASREGSLSSSSTKTDRLCIGREEGGGLEEGVKEGVEIGVRETWEGDL